MKQGFYTCVAASVLLFLKKCKKTFKKYIFIYLKQHNWIYYENGTFKSFYVFFVQSAIENLI